jgi:TP901 family phage tail tape measure protein
VANESSVLVRLRLLGGQRFAQEAKTASRGLGSVGSQTQKVSTRLNGVNKVLGATAMAMRTVGVGAVIGVGAGMAYGIKTSANFEQSMANVQARLLTTRSVMQQLQDQALKLGADTSFSAQQAAEAMGEFAAAGFDAQQIMRIMPGTLNLAAAAGTDLAFAAETTGAVIRQFGLGARDATHVADVMTMAVNKSAISMEDLAMSMKYVGPVAGRFNQSMEDISAATAILGNVGIKGETAGTTLRRALVNIVKPSIKTQKVLKDVGVTTAEFGKASVDAKGNLRGLPSILGNLSKHFEGLSKPDRRRVLAQLFGVEALPGMVTLFDMGEKRIKRMSSELLNSGGAAKRTAGIMRNTVKGAWDTFTGSVETASVRLMTRFNPAIREALRGASRLVNTGSGALSSFATGVGGGRQDAGGAKGERAIGNVASSMSGAEKAGLKVRSALGGVVAWATANMPRLGAALMTAGKSLMEALAPAMPFISNVVLPLLKGLAMGVMSTVVVAFKVGIAIIKVLATVLGFIGKAAAPLKPVFTGIGYVIGFLAAGPILKFLGGLRYLGVAFKLLLMPVRLAMGALSIGGRVIVKVAGFFQRALTGVLRFVSTFQSMPARVIRGALNMLQGVINTVGRLPGRLLSLAKRAGSGLINGLISGAKSLLGALGSMMGNVGKGMVNGVLDAIKSAPNTIMQALLDLVPGPLRGAIKKVTGWLPGIATGGRIIRGGAAIVGERGPELVKMRAGSTVYDAEQTRRARATMAPAAPLYLTANLLLSGKQIHSEVFRIDRQMAEAT